jgi:PAS domain S-box-containing protein
MEENQSINRDDEPFRSVSDQTPLLIWASGRDRLYYFFNPVWLAYTGRTMEQELGNGWTEAVHPDDLQQCIAIYNGSFEARKEFTRVYRLKRHDGLYRRIADRAAPRYHQGTFMGYAGFCIDISEPLEDEKLKNDLVGAGALQKEQHLNEELAATNEELSAANEELTSINDELRQTQDDLADLNRNLEKIVATRTQALRKTEAEAQSLNEELNATNEELAAANEELIAINEELVESRAIIQRSEQLFKSIAVNIPKSLIIVIGKDHRFMAVEGELMAKLGFDSKDYVGKHPADVSRGRYEASKYLYERVLAGEQFTIDRKGEGGEDFRMEFVPLRDERREVYAALIIALDITDIRLTEEKSAKLAAIVAYSDDAIISKTLEGIVTSWNASAERMFGYSEKEMIGQPILKIIPEDRKEEEPRILERMRKGERVDHFETQRITRNQQILDVSLTISPLRDSEGHVIGVSKIARDISEKKRDELRKNDFIGMVSHELKTPLTSLTALVQVLQKKLRTDDDEFISGALENANKQVRKMTGLINGFLNISRFESGKMPIVKQEFLLNELLDEAIADTKLTAADRTIHFDQQAPVKVYADRDKIGSVILNLLSNAIKYSPKSSAIEVTYKTNGAKAEVSIKDEGIGIKPADIGKLFDRYYRVEADYTQNISGFGVGLYLSAEIIGRHQGDIWVESEFGKGSTFYFTVPIS